MKYLKFIGAALFIMLLLVVLVALIIIGIPLAILAFVYRKAKLTYAVLSGNRELFNKLIEKREKDKEFIKHKFNELLTILEKEKSISICQCECEDCDSCDKCCND